MSFALLLAIALAVVTPEEPAAAAPAAAPEAAKPDAAKVRAVVHLRDGGLVRGTVKKMRPGRSITLKLASGKSITLDDEDVIEIQIYGRAAPADAGAGPAEPARGEEFPEQKIKSAKSAPARTAPAPAAAAANPRATRPPILPQPSRASVLDTVYLSDGSLVRGTIESEKPDLVIRLVSGRKRTVPASSVQRVEQGRKP